MTPQEKAKELIEQARKASSFQYQEYAGSYYKWFEHNTDTLKFIALITVDEILKLYWTDINALAFWQEVKSELEVHG